MHKLFHIPHNAESTSIDPIDSAFSIEPEVTTNEHSSDDVITDSNDIDLTKKAPIDTSAQYGEFDHPFVGENTDTDHRHEEAENVISQKLDMIENCSTENNLQEEKQSNFINLIRKCMDMAIQKIPFASFHIGNFPTPEMIEAQEVFLRKEYEKAFQILIQLPNGGNVLTQYAIGMMYLKGLGVNKDLQCAEKWLKKAAPFNEEAADVISIIEISHLLDDCKEDSNFDFVANTLLELDNEYAAYTYGKLWLDGKIQSGDKYIAVNSLIHAAKKGFQPAVTELEKLEDEYSLPHSEIVFGRWDMLIKTVIKEL